MVFQTCGCLKGPMTMGFSWDKHLSSPITYVLELSEECDWEWTTSWLNSIFPESTVAIGLNLESPSLMLFWEGFAFMASKNKDI